MSPNFLGISRDLEDFGSNNANS